MAPQLFAKESFEISVPAAPITYIGPFPITNSMILGGIGVVVMLIVFAYVVSKVRRGQHNRFVGLVQWAFEGMYNGVLEIIPDKQMAKSIAPLALTIFFTVLFTYWIEIIPGVGVAVKYHGQELFRSLPTDLNFTLALAIITMTSVQFYAIKRHGFFGNIGRYLVNPFKNPLGSFEGLLEIIGEFSRLVALAFRLFGNAFAGSVLLMIVGAMSSYLAALTLPFFFAFELFIGFIQAYVFYVLTIIFASLAVMSHGDHDDAHSAANHPKEVAATK